MTTQWLTLAGASAYVGSTSCRGATAPNTIRRWIKDGLSGVHLEAQYRGGMLMTTAEYLETFFERVSLAKRGPTPKSRRRAALLAKARLEKAGAL